MSPEKAAVASHEWDKEFHQWLVFRGITWPGGWDKITREAREQLAAIFEKGFDNVTSEKLGYEVKPLERRKRNANDSRNRP